MLEVLLAVMLFSLMSLGSFMLAVDISNKDAQQNLEWEALRYAEEGLEVARHIRDKDFLSLVAGDYGLSYSGDEWSWDTAPEDIDGFYSRTITVSDVYRDGSGDIVDSGGTLDVSTKKISSTVTWSWRGVLDKSVTLETLLTNWSSWEWEQTTCTEFATGSFTSTGTSPAAGPPANNCVLQLELVEQAGEFFVSTDIGEHGNDVVVDNGYAYVATHKTNEGLAIVDVSDIEAPLVLGHANVGAKGRSTTKSGNWLYMGVEKSNGGLAIIDVSDPNSPTVSSQIDVGGYGNEIAVDGNGYLFMGVEDSGAGFVVYDISDPESPSQEASLDLGAELRAVRLDGNYVYAGTEDSNAGFQVIDISSPSSPSILASLDLGSEVNAIWVEGSFAYVALDTTSDSLAIVDISDPENPSLVTSLDVGEAIQDLAKDGNYLYLALDQVSPGMGVVNVTSPAAPYLAFTLEVNGKGTAVTIDGDEVYVGVDTANAGLVVTGAADVSVATSGSYVTDVLDTGSEDVRYNYLDWDATSVPGGTMTIQMRTASTVAGLSSATWVGPDGTSSSSYDTEKTLIETDPSASGLRYAQLKVSFTSDGYSSPALNSISIFYQP